jgi:hypothetical protein
MKDFQNFLNQVLPPASEEDMIVAIGVLVQEANEDSRQTAQEDPLQKRAKEIWLELQEDIFEYGFMAEFAEFLLENPGLSVFELDRQFRNEWDL